MTRYQKLLLIAFFVVWVWAAISPNYRQDWFFENILVFLFVPLFLIVSRRYRLSDLSYTLITLFMIMHVIGSHYTFAEVPFGKPLGQWFGTERNSYDRLVHFMWGFLLIFPVWEVLTKFAKVQKLWSYLLSFCVIVGLSGMFEVVEWIAAVNVSVDLGKAYLGTQGDIWDAQKDVAMATIGAIITMIITRIKNPKVS